MATRLRMTKGPFPQNHWMSEQRIRMGATSGNTDMRKDFSGELSPARELERDQQDAHPTWLTRRLKYQTLNWDLLKE